MKDLMWIPFVAIIALLPRLDDAAGPWAAYGISMVLFFLGAAIWIRLSEKETNDE